MAMTFRLLRLAPLILSFTYVCPVVDGKQQSLRSRSIGLSKVASAAEPTATTTAASDAGNSSTNDTAKQIIENGLVNGTVNSLYWTVVDSTIAAAGLVTAKPVSINDPGPTPTPDPYTAILGTAMTVNPVDTPQASAELDDYQLATPPPPIPQGPAQKTGYKMSVLPYQMAIGAKILYDMSEKVTPSPLPAQEFVDATFVAQCPMVMKSREVFITPPCSGGNGLGTWMDQNNDRAILRWKTNSNGGLDFAVDSAVTGEGSVLFASINQQFTLKSNSFTVLNCMGVLRYTVEETVVKVESMAENAQSTAIDHDVSQSSEAIFYQYIIRHPNGTIAGKSSQYRLPESNINFTAVSPDSLHIETVLVAKRSGSWQGSEWRSCKTQSSTTSDGATTLKAVQGWDLDFPKTKTAHLVSVSTVQDLEMVSAAVMTLLAWREETVGSGGFEHSGQGTLYWSLVTSGLWVIFVLFFLAAVAVVLQRYDIVKKLKRFFFTLEAVVLPKRPHQVRQAQLQAAW